MSTVWLRQINLDSAFHMREMPKTSNEAPNAYSAGDAKLV